MSASTHILFITLKQIPKSLYKRARTIYNLLNIAKLISEKSEPIYDAVSTVNFGSGCRSPNANFKGYRVISHVALGKLLSFLKL